MKPVKFKSILTRSTGDYGGMYFPVPERVARRFEARNGTRRVLCTVNGELTFPCALLPNTKVGFYIGTNKKIRDTLRIEAGDQVALELVADESRYGFPMPEELQEVLNQDPEGDRAFHSLTPGMQRSMLYSIGRLKDVDRRIHTALTLVQHLKKNGKVIYEELKEELKRPLF